MTWKIVEGCYGCGMCAQCTGIEMQGRSAVVVDNKSPCLEEMAKICPAEIIQNI